MTESIIKHTSKTVFIMVVFSLVGTLFLAKTYFATKSPIQASEAAAKMKLFEQVLPPSEHDNNLLNDVIHVPAGGELNNREGTKIYIARLNNHATAVILEATAQDGYSGDIKLLIAVRKDGSLGGVRVISHKETPGLGDYIDVAHGDWILAFKNLSLSNPTTEMWKVKKDGGQFDYMAGATITPRAVVKATQRALSYVAQHQNTLFAETPADKH
ncbi:MAG: electron transport complex subunit RsxG [Methylophilus sp.]|nr:electron transport complex subunit RsxG [Methylophilus sp.]